MPRPPWQCAIAMIGLGWAAITAPAATAGRIDPAQFRSIDLGGLRLGMTLPAVEAFMRARDDLAPPSASYTQKSGRLKKVWWSGTLTSLSAWRKAGARPMIAPKAAR